MGITNQCRQTEIASVERRDVGKGGCRDLRFFSWERSDDNIVPNCIVRRWKAKYSKSPLTTLTLARPAVVLLLSIFSGLRLGVVEGLDEHAGYKFEASQKHDLVHRLFTTVKGNQQAETAPATNLMKIVEKGCEELNKSIGPGARRLRPFGASACRQFWTAVKEDIEDEQRKILEQSAAMSKAIFMHTGMTATGYTDGLMSSTSTFPNFR